VIAFRIPKTPYLVVDVQLAAESYASTLKASGSRNNIEIDQQFTNDAEVSSG
jgi:hypothetical protein